MVQNVWWTIFPYLGIPIHLNMHVVLGVEANPDPATRNELIFTYQEDHIFWVESYLALNPVLTLGLGPFFLEHLRPLAGWLACSTPNSIEPHNNLLFAQLASILVLGYWHTHNFLHLSGACFWKQTLLSKDMLCDSA